MRAPWLGVVVAMGLAAGPSFQAGGVAPPSSDEFSPLVRHAKQDLARRLDVEVVRIEFVESISVIWPNGSLGCPRPGMRYTMMLVEGALIRLAFEGRVYQYHAGGARGAFLCEKPAAPLKPRLDPVQ